MSIERARTLVDRIYNDSDSIMDPGSLIDELGSLCREDAEVRELMVKTLHERTKIGAYGSLSVAKRLMMVSLARTQNPAMSDELGKQLMLPDDGTSTEVWEIRDGAAFALGRLGCKEAVPVLEKAAEAGHAYQACRDALKKLREALGESDDRPQRSQSELDADLLEATEKGDKAAVEQLLKDGASVDSRHPEWQQTPLSIASWASETSDAVYVEILGTLVEHGAALQMGNKDGWSPLHLSSYHGLVPRVRFLVEHGADKGAAVTSGHFAGQTPLDMASSQGKHEVVEILTASSSPDVVEPKREPDPAPDPETERETEAAPEPGDDQVNDEWPPRKKWWQFWMAHGFRRLERPNTGRFAGQDVLFSRRKLHLRVLPTSALLTTERYRP